MGQDLPDHTRAVEVGVTVDTNVIFPLPAHEAAAGGAGVFSGGAVIYTTVVVWQVSVGMVGDLKEILIISDNYAKTMIRITIAGTVWCTNWTPTSSMPIIFEDLKLAAGSVVLIEARSSDGTAIEVDAIIVAKEIG